MQKSEKQKKKHEAYLKGLYKKGIVNAWLYPNVRAVNKAMRSAAPGYSFTDITKVGLGSKHIEWKGQKRSVRSVAAENGISIHKVWVRLRQGWPLYTALRSDI